MPEFHPGAGEGAGGGAVLVPTAEFMQATRASAQTTALGVGSPVLFDTVAASAGSSISLNTGTGVFTLAAGKTYRLWASLTNVTGNSQYQWRNDTAAVDIGNRSQLIPNSSRVAATDEGNGINQAIITTSVITDVELEIKTSPTQIGMAPDRFPVAYIEVLIGAGAGSLSVIGYTLMGGSDFGIPDAGKFCTSNGIHSSTANSALDHTSEHTIPKAGTLATLSWNTESADATTVIKLHKNAIVVETVTLSGTTGTDSSLTTTVAVGDQIGIEFDAGTPPQNGTYIIYIE